MSKEDNENPLEILMEILHSRNILPFHDQSRDPYVMLDDSGGTVMRVDSSAFKRLLHNCMWKARGHATSAETVNVAARIMECEALDGMQVPLAVRVAEMGDSLFYDISRSATVKISTSGWEIIGHALPNVFRRFDHQKDQVIPDQNCSAAIDELLNLFNVQNERDRLLLKVYIVAAFIPGFPHPVLVVHGSQGSAKSTLCRLLKSLIDPSLADSLCITNDRDTTELVQTASHHWLLVLDNVSFISDRVSDTLARICTGGALSKRKLYTNSEDHIFNVRHLVVINGIGQVVTRSDLLDRTILIGLEEIPKHRRMSEREVNQRFEELKPKVLSGIFTAVSYAMRERPNIKLENMPRLADFAEWGSAISKGLDIDPDVFQNAYSENVNVQNREAIEASPTASVIIEYMKDRDEVTLSPSELYSELEFIAVRLNLQNSSEFPKAASWLWKRIAIIRPNLRSAGINVAQEKGEVRLIKLWKDPAGGSSIGEIDSKDGRDRNIYENGEGRAVDECQDRSQT